MSFGAWVVSQQMRNVVAAPTIQYVPAPMPQPRLSLTPSWGTRNPVDQAIDQVNQEWRDHRRQEAVDEVSR